MDRITIVKVESRRKNSFVTGTAPWGYMSCITRDA